MALGFHGASPRRLLGEGKEGNEVQRYGFAGENSSNVDGETGGSESKNCPGMPPVVFSTPELDLRFEMTGTSNRTHVNAV